MNIDLHFHMIPPFFLEELRRSDNPWRKRVLFDEHGRQVMRIGRLSIPMDPNHYDAEAILAAMDDMRIDVAAISPSPILFHNHMTGEVVSDLYARVNDHLIGMFHSHPDRFKPLGTIDMQSGDVAIKEINRIMDAGLGGFEIETNIAGRNLDDPAFLPIFEQAAKRDAVIFLHPLAVLGADRMQAWYLTNLIGNPTETAVAAASLIFGGVMEKFPHLKIVLPHGGGTTPCLCGRWDHGTSVRPELTHMQALPTDLVRRFFFDTLTHSEAALSLLLEVAGTNQLVLGSDHPYDMAELDIVQRIEDRTDLTDAAKAAILGGNAKRLLGLA